VPVERVKEFQVQLIEFLTTRKELLLHKICQQKQLSEELIEELKAAADQFKEAWK
jgi:F0F1-type ATP synthase alpha subunit